MIGSFLRYETLSVEELLKAVYSNQVYAVLDGCGSEKILTKLIAWIPSKANCLFESEALEMNWAVAPYLVTVERNTLNWIVSTVWDEPWGILVIAECEKKELYKHLRKFLLVEDPEGYIMYFRFYDPRVLDVFLPTCRKDELECLFGPISYFGIRTEQPGKFILTKLRNRPNLMTVTNARSFKHNRT